MINLKQIATGIFASSLLISSSSFADETPDPIKRFNDTHAQYCGEKQSPRITRFCDRLEQIQSEFEQQTRICTFGEATESVSECHEENNAEISGRLEKLIANTGHALKRGDREANGVSKNPRTWKCSDLDCE